MITIGYIEVPDTLTQTMQAAEKLGHQVFIVGTFDGFHPMVAIVADPAVTAPRTCPECGNIIDRPSCPGCPRCEFEFEMSTSLVR